MYAVMKLNTKIEITDVFNQKHGINLEDKTMAGYIPVYKTKREAIKHTEKGKYQMLKIQKSK